MTALLRLAAGAGLALLAALPAAAQSARFAGWDAMVDPGFHFDPDERPVLGFALQSSPAARAALDEVETLLDRGDAAAAGRLLRKVAADHPAQWLQVADELEDGGGRWVGAGEWALHLLASRIPSEVRATLATPEERERLARASEWRDAPALRSLAIELDGLPEARRALVTLHRLAAEEGRAEVAAALAARIAVLDGGVGDAVGDVVGPAAAFTPGPPPTPPAPTVGAADASPPLLAEQRRLESTWPAWSGSVRDGLGYPLAITRLVARDSRRRHPFLALPSHPSASPLRLEAPFAPVIPVLDGGLIFVSDAISVSALDAVSGRPLWHHAGPLEELDDGGRAGESFDLGVYATPERRRAISPYLEARPVLAGDRVLASLQVTEPWRETDEFDGYPINHPLPRRRLVCLDLGTGELLWRQERPALGESDFVNRLDVHGPPVVEGDLVYVAGSITEGAINAYAAAFDLATGELAWRTLLCTGQAELTMFNRPFQEHVVAPPDLHDGRLFVGTNLGLVASVDAASGRLRWVTSYPVIERHSSRGLRPSNARPVHWISAAPVVEGGTLVVAPLDGQVLLGLDPSTGRRLWREGLAAAGGDRQSARHQVLPTGDGRLLVASDDGVEGFDAATGRPLWPATSFAGFAPLSGAATLCGPVLLVPVHPWLLVLDGRDGSLLADHLAPESGFLLQRASLSGPVLVMTDGASVFAHVDEDRLRDEHEPQATAVPGSQLVLAELALARERFDEAGQRFAAVLEADAPQLAARARSGLLSAALSRARRTDTPEAWAGLLAAALDGAELLSLADLALPALARLGSDEHLLPWLARVAELDPGREVSLGSDGPRPAALAYALRRLPFETPEAAVTLLAGLIQGGVEGRWDGLAMAEMAARRIDGLLALHGRSLYATLEADARAARDRGLSLDALERLFPNAEVVAAGLAERLATRLAEGQADQVFQEPLRTSSPALLALRAQAAAALGEETYARALRGEPALPEVLFGLPTDLGARQRVEVHAQRSVVFRAVDGRPSERLAGCAIGLVDGLGEIFCVDTRAGRLLWSGRGLPGGARSVTSNVDLVLAGELLVVRGHNEVMALGLEDGLPRWSRLLVGSVQEVLAAQGLLLCLVESSLGDFRVEARGLATGLLAWRVDLPGEKGARLYRAGGQVMCLVTGGLGPGGAGSQRRLLVLDLLRGAVESSTPVGDRVAVVNVGHDPPVLFLTEQRGVGSRLAVFQPHPARVLWEAEVASPRPTTRNVFPTTAGRAVLCETQPAPERRGRSRDRLQSIDLRQGPLPARSQAAPGRLLGLAGRPGSLVVLADPDEPARLTVLDGGTLEQLAAPTLTGAGLQADLMTVIHGRDGFLLLAESVEPGARTLWLLGPGRSEQGVELDGDRGGPGLVQLTEGAVLVADGGSVQILGSASR